MNSIVDSTALAHTKSNFEENDSATWEFLFERQREIVRQYACQEFLSGLDLLEKEISVLPSLNILSSALKRLTGWELAPVHGLLDSSEYFTHLANRIFPIATFLRSPENIDYITAPDMWHDVFGHLPLLTIPAYSRFVETISRVILNTNGKKRDELDRLYWYTIEVGLCCCKTPKVYGATQLSSYTEIQDAMSERPTVISFELKQVASRHIDIESFQDRLFCIPSFNYLEELTQELSHSYG